MNEFSRRAFLKGVLSLAASAAIPIELIEKATSAVGLLPDKPTKNPAGYFKINGLIVPVIWMEISRPMGNLDRWGDSIFHSPPELTQIEFTTNHHLYFDREQVTFSVSDKHLPFELTGNAYFSSCSTDCILVSTGEPTWYTYSMSCEIDQYKEDIINV